MSITDLIQQAQGGQGLSQLADQLGLSEETAQNLARMLAPAIGKAAKRQVTQGGLDSVLGAMRGDGQARMFDDASAAASPEGQAQGMAFLEQMMGGKKPAQGMADAAAERAGVDAGTVQQFLPALAAMVQGGLQKQMPDSTIDHMMQQTQSSGGGLMGAIGGLMGGGEAQSAQKGGAMAMLTGMLDADGDGSALDDVLDRFMR